MKKIYFSRTIRILLLFVAYAGPAWATDEAKPTPTQNFKQSGVSMGPQITNKGAGAMIKGEYDNGRAFLNGGLGFNIEGGNNRVMSEINGGVVFGPHNEGLGLRGQLNVKEDFRFQELGIGVGPQWSGKDGDFVAVSAMIHQLQTMRDRAQGGKFGIRAEGRKCVSGGVCFSGYVEPGIVTGMNGHRSMDTSGNYFDVPGYEQKGIGTSFKTGADVRVPLGQMGGMATYLKPSIAYQKVNFDQKNIYGLGPDLKNGTEAITVLFSFGLEF